MDRIIEILVAMAHPNYETASVDDVLELYHTLYTRGLTHVTLGNGEEVHRRWLLSEVIRRIPDSAISFFYASWELEGGGTLLLHDHRVLTERIALLEAIRLDPKWAPPRHDLATTMEKGETVTLHDGRVVGCIDLLVDAIGLDRHHLSYYHLANKLQPGETVTLMYGTTMTASDLIRLAYLGCPNDTDIARAYYALPCCLRLSVQSAH